MTTMQTGSDYYQRGLELAEAGRYQEGLNCIREHLRIMPHDAQALNDAGAILHCLGRDMDAIDSLRKARDLKPDSAEIAWNLVETYLGAGLPAEASQLLDDMERMSILSVDVLNRTATMLLDQGKKGLALDVLLRSYRLWPEQEVLRPILTVIRAKRPKVAFFHNGTAEDSALADACEFVRERFSTESYEGRDPEKISNLMEWCDIAWINGGGEMAAEATRCGGRARVIVSIGRSDVQSRWPEKVQWENVDILAQIGNADVEATLCRQVPDIRNRTRLVVVPNGVNLDRYPFHHRERGKNLACIGSLTMETNPALLVQCMQKMHYIDAEYRLFFSGVFENPALEEYIRHMVQTLGLTDVVFFEPHPGDLNNWLCDKHFVVTAGIGKSNVQGLLVGMACGLKPVVHNFVGADQLLPPHHLFNIAEEFCEQVLSHDYEPQQYRRFVEEHHPIQRQLKMVDGILTQLETEIEMQAASAPSSGFAEIVDVPACSQSDTQ